MNITNRTTHHVQQGTEAWMALRADYLTASEAPAALGVSRYLSRSDLIRQKATGVTPEHDSFTLKRFAEGHEAEAAARPLAEIEIGDDLSPVTMTVEVDGLPLLASLDGLDFDGSTAWECKLWNEDLAEQVRTNNLSANYTVQMDQQQLVSGAKRHLFTCSDGTPERTVHCWYESSDEKKALLLTSMRMIKKEIDSYKPEAEAAPEVVGQAPDQLPALRIDVTGMVTASNLEGFKAVALRTIGAIKTTLTTDQDFLDAEQTVKWCGNVESSLAAAKQHALSQTESIDRLFRTIDEISEQARTVRLKLEKLVKSEKEARKEQIVMQAQRSLDDHITELNRELGANYLQRVAGVFAPVIKGLKSLDSMQDKVQAELARQITDANAKRDCFKANRKHLVQDDGDWIALFPDFATVGTKAAEDFQALAALRIGQHKEAEAKRLEAQREQIRKEEAARLEREAAEAERQRIQQQAQQEQAEIAKAVQAGEVAAPVASDLATLVQANATEAVAGVDAQQAISTAKASSAADPGPVMTLGQVNALLEGSGLGKISAATLEHHSIPFNRERGAVNIHAAQVKRLLILLSLGMRKLADEVMAETV